MKMKLATLALLATTQIAIAEPTDTAIAVAGTAGYQRRLINPQLCTAFMALQFITQPWI